MLGWIRVRNVAVIDELEVDFEPGLNLITGETGAGKSILIDALGLVLGGKGSTDLIRAGAEKASVEAGFVLPDEAHAASRLLSDMGIELEPDEDLVIRRELTSVGRGKIFVNGVSTPRNGLKELASQLVDIQGQGEHYALLRPGAALALLDRHALNDTLRASVAEAFRELRRLERKVEELEDIAGAREERRETLTFEISEIDRVSPRSGEDEHLLEQRQRSVHAEKLRGLSEEAYQALYDADGSAMSQLGLVWKRLDELARIDSTWESVRDSRPEIDGVLEDLALKLRNYADEVEVSPARSEEIESRLALIERLKKKYGGTLDAVLQRREASERALAELESSEESLERARADLSTAYESYKKRALMLSTARSKAAEKLVSRVNRELPSLALEKARFEVRVARAELDEGGSTETFRESGIDTVEFRFTANPGEAPRPLERVASGGELSRFLLALESLSAKGKAPKTLVFDEVDAGIGGRVAEAVGEKLEELSKTHQVICVTHLPQVASFARAHFRIDKIVARGRTETRIARLDDEGRVDELARMLAGAKVSETARRHARQLLKESSTTSRTK